MSSMTLSHECLSILLVHKQLLPIAGAAISQEGSAPSTLFKAPQCLGFDMQTERKPASQLF